MSFNIHDQAKNACMLSGQLEDEGYDWWWHSFTGHNEKTGEERSFFIEYFLCNPELGEDVPILGQAEENKKAGRKPSYLMIKAGAWGKGFAVVADEVRNLAGKSAEAASDTSTLIENTIASVERGNKLCTEVAEMMTGVSEAAGKVAELNTGIFNSSAKLADSVEQVNMGMEQISSVVQTNSATAEQSAAASEELSGQAVMLERLVGEFTLE